MKSTSAIKITLFAILTILVLGGCRSTPVYSVADSQFTTASGKELSLDEMKSAIISSGTSLGWFFTEKAPGHLLGTIAIRKHIAKVDVKFNAKTFSITYNDSENLDYDGINIHKNYNGWVRNLQTSISARLGSM